MNSLPNPENVTRTILPNGIILLIKQNPFTESIAVKGLLNCGSCCDTPAKSGLMSIVASCLTSGTETHDFAQIHSTLEDIGASLTYNTGVHKIGISGKSLAEDLPTLLELLRETLAEPIFPQQYLDLAIRRAVTGWEYRQSDTEAKAEETFYGALFGTDHPYGLTGDGTPETLLSFNRQQVIEHYRRYFGPKNMVLSIVGGIEPQAALDTVRRTLGNWEKPQETPEAFPGFSENIPSMQRLHIEIPEKSEISLMTGSYGPCRTDPLYTAVTLGNNILGQFGMMGRIGKSVREDNGLAYYAGSNIDAMLRGGTWTVSAGTNPENCQQALDLIQAEIRRFCTETVSEEELSEVKQSSIGSLPLSLETNAGVAAALLSQEIYGFGLDYFSELEGKIRAVTAEDILHAAQTFIDPDRLITVTAGTLEAEA